jgi:putative endonuclease
MKMNQETGRIGEDIAEDFLRNQGYSIRERNYRYKRYGEIDLIVAKDSLLVFVEVKRRMTKLFGGPLYAVSSQKKNNIRKIASQYLSTYDFSSHNNITCRFDLIAITGQSVEWIQDMFR